MDLTRRGEGLWWAATCERTLCASSDGAISANGLLAMKDSVFTNQSAVEAGRVKVLTANTGSARGWYFFGKKDMSEPRV